MGAALAMSKMASYAKETKPFEIKRLDSTGKVHVLACVPRKTSTGGYWDKDEPPVMKMKSGGIVHIETKNHLFGEVVPGITLTVIIARNLLTFQELQTYPKSLTGQ